MKNTAEILLILNFIDNKFLRPKYYTLYIIVFTKCNL